MTIETIIKKVKPTVSVISMLLGMSISSLSKESVFITGVALLLIIIGIWSWFAWTIGSEFENTSQSD
ncbi:MAG: hypothetical protein KAS01_02305 [Candidatus Pacebacteria bacterium]|nr:hypothetical protein [Candidatus Paceibacterota bacterium]